MIGFVVTTEVLATLETGLASAFVARGIPQYLTLGAVEVVSGDYAGQWFIAFPDDALQQPLHGNHTLQDFPEFESLIAMLGGTESRVDLILQPPTP